MRHLSVRARLNLFFGIIIFLTLSFGIFSILQSRHSRAVVRLLYSADIANYDVSAATIEINRYLVSEEAEDYKHTKIYLDSAEVRLALATELTTGIGDTQGQVDVKRGLEQVKKFSQLCATFPEQLRESSARIDAVVEAYDVLMKEIRTFSNVPSEFLVRMCEGNDYVNFYFGRGNLAVLGEAISNFSVLIPLAPTPTLAQHIRDIIQSVQDLETFAKGFDVLKKELASQSVQCSETLDEVSSYFVTSYKEDHETLFRYTVAVLLVVIGFSVAVSQYTARTIVFALRQGVEQMQLCATGNFNSRLSRELLKRTDEFGLLARSIEEMTEHVRQAIGDVKQGAGEVGSASAHLNVVSQKVSQGTNAQASSAEEVSSAMEEMTANIDQNADNATQTQHIAQSMEGKIVEANTLSQRSLESVQSITEKISIISEIAAQTNILALNAAVEAARAGEHGRGFSVVASEIRKLAERSRAAAEEIVDYSSRSLTDTHLAAKALDDVLPDVKHTAQLVSEIAMASQEQRLGVEQINSALQQLSEIVQQNAVASDEMAHSAEALNQQAETLNRASGYFVIA